MEGLELLLCRLDWGREARSLPWEPAGFCRGRGMELQRGASEGQAGMLLCGGLPRDVPQGPETSMVGPSRPQA